MKSALIHADRQTDKHEANWPLCDGANAHKNHMWQPGRKPYKATCQLRRINGMKNQSQFCRLPLRVLKDVCACQFHVISSPQTTWFTFRSEIRKTSDRNFWTALKCNSLALRFPKSASLSLLRALKEIIQSATTIKCALDCSVYKAFKHGYRIQINCLVSFGAESNRNIKFWN
jgi:hypothetical protein